MIAATQDMAETLLSRHLQEFAAGHVAILGVGNRDRCDDGAGSLVAEEVAARLAGRSGALVIDTGAVPENYLEKVARSRPDSILIVDAVDFGGAPGEFRLLDPDSIGPSGLSSHALSLRMAAEFFKVRTRARVVFLAIQPAHVGWGTALSDGVGRAVTLVADVVSGALAQSRGDQPDRHAYKFMPGERG